MASLILGAAGSAIGSALGSFSLFGTVISGAQIGGALGAYAAETEQNLALTAATGSWNGLAESLKAESALGPSYAWVNAVRALVRPALTLGLGGFLCAAFFAVPAPERAPISDTLIFAAVTALTWWFGDRAPKKA